jgi:hypothetical protein
MLYISAFLTLTLVMVKPVFIFICVIPYFLLLIRRPNLPLILNSLVVSLILVPLLSLVISNGIRFGVYSISPAGSISLLGVTSTLASAPIYPSDSDQTRAVFKLINAGRLEMTASSDLSKLALLESSNLFESVCHNYQLVLDLPKKLNLAWKEIFPIISNYSHRVIAHNSELYLQFVFNSLKSLQLSLLYITTSLVSALCLLSNPKLRHVGLATFIFILVHIGTITIVSLSGIIHSRYYNVTTTPLMVISFLTILIAVREFSSRFKRFSQHNPQSY